MCDQLSRLIYVFDFLRGCPGSLEARRVLLTVHTLALRIKSSSLDENKVLTAFRQLAERPLDIPLLDCSQSGQWLSMIDPESCIGAADNTVFATLLEQRALGLGGLDVADRRCSHNGLGVLAGYREIDLFDTASPSAKSAKDSSRVRGEDTKAAIVVALSQVQKDLNNQLRNSCERTGYIPWSPASCHGAPD